MKKISRLQYITTSAALAEKACSSGIDWIQLRLKNTSHDAYKAIAKDVQAVCKTYNATFIINDNVLLAAELQADGVHLGKQDMPVAEAWKILGNNFIIGATANTAADVMHHAMQPVDYIGLGPFRFTTTKENLSPVLGIEGYKNIFSTVKNMKTPPVVAIGGIIQEDVETLMQTGIHGIAVSGIISGSEDIPQTIKSLLQLLPKHVNTDIHE